MEGRKGGKLSRFRQFITSILSIELQLRSLLQIFLSIGFPSPANFLRFGRQLIVVLQHESLLLEVKLKQPSSSFDTISSDSLQHQTLSTSRLCTDCSSLGVNNFLSLPQRSMNKDLRQEKVLGGGIAFVMVKFDYLSSTNDQDQKYYK